MLVADEPGARVLLAVVAVALAAAAVREGLLRPVLVADADGVAVREGTILRRVPWDAPLRVRATSSRVRLVRTSWLEVEAETVLVLLHPWRLGTSAEDAARAVAAVRPPVNPR